MKANKLAVWAAAMVILVVYAANVSVSEAACNVMELSSCAAAITSSAKPSPMCCTKLKQQQSCLCQYAKDPTYGKYINSPGARKVAQACGVPIPKC